jgi:GTP-binding protein
LKIVSCRFDRAATRAAEEPRAPGPDIVFVGRSNVGKSSLINRLLGSKGLARTSSRPGRTQSVNFYRVNESCWFVDLPGYGWAKAPVAVRRAWKPMVEGYLERRSAGIALVVLVVDSRNEVSALDLTMRDGLDARALPYVVVATKSDKLPASGRAGVARRLAPVVGLHGRAGRPLVASAVTGLGMRELWGHLDTALEAHGTRT